MISGRVSAELDPMVTIEMGSIQGIFQPVDFVVDTGFSGELALPPELIQSLGLEYIDDVRVVMADRQGRWVGAYDGAVSWHGEPMAVIVLDMGSEPLLGMALLLGSQLTVSAGQTGLWL